MMLEQFTVENFKAFKHLELKDLGHINIFVGDNNVGKTCLLQALALSIYLEYYHVNTRELKEKLPLLFRSTIQNLFFKQDSSQSISLEHSKIEETIIVQRIQSKTIIQFKEKDSVIFSNKSSVIGDSNPQSCHFGLDIESFKVSNDVYVLDNPLQELNRLCYLPTETAYKPLATQNYNHFVDEDLEAEEKISNTLKKLDKRLKDIRYTIDTDLNAQLTIGLEGMPKRLPLESMGDGFAKLLGLACCLEKQGVSYTCIDEPENGFHYKTQTSFWKLLANWSLEGDKQSFIATHSYELISCLNDLLTADPTLLERGLKVRVYRLERDESDPEKINAIKMTEKNLATLVGMDLEVR